VLDGLRGNKSTALMGRLTAWRLAAYEWAQIETWLQQPPGPGRKRTVNLRDIMDAILYLNRTSCPWRMLSHELPSWQHVAYYIGPMLY
jgi:transposase